MNDEPLNRPGTQLDPVAHAAHFWFAWAARATTDSLTFRSGSFMTTARSRRSGPAPEARTIRPVVQRPFSPGRNGLTLTFSVDAAGTITETGTTWDKFGAASLGALAGAQLEALVHG